jgi:hypothetical protein
MTEQKATIVVEFEFYPDENDTAREEFLGLSQEQQNKLLAKMLDQEFSNNIGFDGLWWHFDKKIDPNEQETKCAECGNGTIWRDCPDHGEGCYALECQDCFTLDKDCENNG